MVLHPLSGDDPIRVVDLEAQAVAWRAGRENRVRNIGEELAHGISWKTTNCWARPGRAAMFAASTLELERSNASKACQATRDGASFAE
jgi:hypothetical protein